MQNLFLERNDNNCLVLVGEDKSIVSHWQQGLHPQMSAPNQGFMHFSVQSP